MEIHHLGFRAMNCEMGAWVVAADPQAARAHLVAVRDFIQAVEARLSRFRPDSELCRLNARPGEPVPVSPLLWEAITHAVNAARRTNGLYDPTILDALEAAGYDRSFDQRQMTNGGRLAPHLELGPSSSVTPRATWRDIRLDPDTRSVMLPPGVRLDLGGIAKGWVADRAADRLSSLGPCLVDAGGDLAVRGMPPGQVGWPIGVADPHRPDEDLAVLLLRDGGVATSGVDYRRWTLNGVPQHHIIDPRTGRPARTDLFSVTVLAPNAIDADLHALVVLLLGAQQGRYYLAGRCNVEALLIHADGRQFTTPGFEHLRC